MELAKRQERDFCAEIVLKTDRQNDDHPHSKFLLNLLSQARDKIEETIKTKGFEFLILPRFVGADCVGRLLKEA